jgi:hypothetical protein
MNEQVKNYFDRYYTNLSNNQAALNQKLDQILSNQLAIHNQLDRSYKANIINRPPLKGVTPKTLYLGYKSGWSIFDLATLTGESSDTIMNKIEKYAKDNT